jgi:hypothetical protein
MPVRAALAEFGLPGQWAAPSCGQPFVVLTFESTLTSQFVIRRDKDGADASDVLTYAFGKRGNNLGSTGESHLRLGVPAGVDTTCSTLGPFDSAPRAAPLPSSPRPQSLHAVCVVEQQSDFLLHDEQTTACCSIS